MLSQNCHTAESLYQICGMAGWRDGPKIKTGCGILTKILYGKRDLVSMRDAGFIANSAGKTRKFQGYLRNSDLSVVV
jgi:hypothetical protein